MSIATYLIVRALSNPMSLCQIETFDRPGPSWRWR